MTTEDQPTDPLPPGVAFSAEEVRVTILRAIAAQPVPDVRTELLELLDAGAPMCVDTFDEHGYTRLGLMAPDGLLVFGTAHWRTLADNLA